MKFFHPNFKAERERLAQEKKAAKLEKLRKFVKEGESKQALLPLVLVICRFF